MRPMVAFIFLNMATIVRRTNAESANNSSGYLKAEARKARSAGCADNRGLSILDQQPSLNSEVPFFMFGRRWVYILLNIEDALKFCGSSVSQHLVEGLKAEIKKKIEDENLPVQTLAYIGLCPCDCADMCKSYGVPEHTVPFESNVKYCLFSDKTPVAFPIPTTTPTTSIATTTYTTTTISPTAIPSSSLTTTILSARTPSSFTPSTTGIFSSSSDIAFGTTIKRSSASTSAPLGETSSQLVTFTSSEAVSEEHSSKFDSLTTLTEYNSKITTVSTLYEDPTKTSEIPRDGAIVSSADPTAALIASTGTNTKPVTRTSESFFSSTTSEQNTPISSSNNLLSSISTAETSQAQSYSTTTVFAESKTKSLSTEEDGSNWQPSGTLRWLSSATKEENDEDVATTGKTKETGTPLYDNSDDAFQTTRSDLTTETVNKELITATSPEILRKSSQQPASSITRKSRVSALSSTSLAPPQGSTKHKSTQMVFDPTTNSLHSSTTQQSTDSQKTHYFQVTGISASQAPQTTLSGSDKLEKITYTASNARTTTTSTLTLSEQSIHKSFSTSVLFQTLQSSQGRSVTLSDSPLSKSTSGDRTFFSRSTSEASQEPATYFSDASSTTARKEQSVQSFYSTSILFETLPSSQDRSSTTTSFDSPLSKSTSGDQTFFSRRTSDASQDPVTDFSDASTTTARKERSVQSFYSTSILFETLLPSQGRSSLLTTPNSPLSKTKSEDRKYSSRSSFDASEDASTYLLDLSTINARNEKSTQNFYSTSIFFETLLSSQGRSSLLTTPNSPLSKTKSEDRKYSSRSSFDASEDASTYLLDLSTINARNEKSTQNFYSTLELFETLQSSQGKSSAITSTLPLSSSPAEDRTFSDKSSLDTSEIATTHPLDDNTTTSYDDKIQITSKTAKTEAEPPHYSFIRPKTTISRSPTSVPHKSTSKHQDLTISSTSSTASGERKETTGKISSSTENTVLYFSAFSEQETAKVATSEGELSAGFQAFSTLISVEKSSSTQTLSEDTSEPAEESTSKLLSLTSKTSMGVDDSGNLTSTMLSTTAKTASSTEKRGTVLTATTDFTTPRDISAAESTLQGLESSSGASDRKWPQSANNGSTHPTLHTSSGNSATETITSFWFGSVTTPIVSFISSAFFASFSLKYNYTTNFASDFLNPWTTTPKMSQLSTSTDSVDGFGNEDFVSHGSETSSTNRNGSSKTEFRTTPTEEVQVLLTSGWQLDRSQLQSFATGFPQIMESTTTEIDNDDMEDVETPWNPRIRKSCEECNQLGTDNCIEVQEGFVCDCKEHWSGFICWKAPNQCRLNKLNCGEHGKCASEVDKAHCECSEGYAGVNCEVAKVNLSFLSSNQRSFLSETTATVLVLSSNEVFLMVVKTILLIYFPKSAQDSQVYYQDLRSIFLSIGALTVLFFQHPGLFNISIIACRMWYCVITVCYSLGIGYITLEAYNVFAVVHLKQRNSWSLATNNVLGQPSLKYTIPVLLALGGTVFATTAIHFDKVASKWSCLGLYNTNTLSLWLPVVLANVCAALAATHFAYSSWIIARHIPQYKQKINVFLKSSELQEKWDTEKCYRNLVFTAACSWILLGKFLTMAMSSDWVTDTIVNKLAVIFSAAFSGLTFMQSFLTNPQMYSRFTWYAMRILPSTYSPNVDPVSLWTREEVLERYGLRKKGVRGRTLPRADGMELHTYPWTPVHTRTKKVGRILVLDGPAFLYFCEKLFNDVRICLSDIVQEWEEEVNSDMLSKPAWRGVRANSDAKSAVDWLDDVIREDKTGERELFQIRSAEAFKKEHSSGRITICSEDVRKQTSYLFRKWASWINRNDPLVESLALQCHEAKNYPSFKIFANLQWNFRVLKPAEVKKHRFHSDYRVALEDYVKWFKNDPLQICSLSTAECYGNTRQVRFLRKSVDVLGPEMIESLEEWWNNDSQLDQQEPQRVENIFDSRWMLTEEEKRTAKINDHVEMVWELAKQNSDYIKRSKAL